MLLYDFEYSGNCYKVRLMLSLLALPYQRQNVDLFTQQQKSAPYLAINPKGEIPALQDGAELVVDSNAVLVYLANRYDPAWYPADPALQARIQYWLSTASNEVQHGLAAARAVKAMGFPRNYAEAVPKANAVLDLLDKHLAEREWLTTSRPTIADIAMYPYCALAEQGEISLQPYAQVRAWLQRVARLPGHVPLPVPPRVQARSN